MQLISSLTLVAAVFSASVSASFLCPDVTKETVPVDLNKYQGKWYEIASSFLIRFTFERNTKCTTAEYTYHPENNTVGVLNTSLRKKTNATTIINGIARPVKQESTDGVYAVSFPSVPFQRNNKSPNYVVVNIWGDYEQVLVGGSCKRYLWVLARTPSIPEDRYTEILAYARKAGYNLRLLNMKKTDQVTCPSP